MESIREKIDYCQKGDYFVPDLELPQTKEMSQGKYSRMRLEYLKRYKRGLYTELMLDGKMEEHLGEIQKTAQTRVEEIVEQLAKENQVNEQMKQENQLQWLGLMNNFGNQAEEIVFDELIFN